MNEKIKITDEELKEIRKYVKKEVPKDDIENPVATALTVIALVIFVAGLVAGFALGTIEVEKRGWDYSYTETAFSFAVAFVYWGVSLISGTLLLGFAEIIKLLEAIKRK